MIYTFLANHKSSFFDEFDYVTLFPAIQQIFQKPEISQIELLINFLNENQDISRLVFEQCPEIAFLIVELIKDDSFDIHFKDRFFLFFNQVTTDSRYLFSSKEQPFPELYMLMLAFFSSGTMSEKNEIAKLLPFMISNTDIAYQLMQDGFFDDLENYLDETNQEAVFQILQSFKNALSLAPVELNELFAELAEPIYMTIASMEDDDSNAGEYSQNPIPNENEIIPLDNIRQLSLLWKAVDNLTQLYPLQSDKILMFCIKKYSDESTEINLEDPSQYDSFISCCSKKLFPHVTSGL